MLMPKKLLFLPALFRNSISVLLCVSCSTVLAQEDAAMQGRSITKVSHELCSAMELHRVMRPGTPVSCDRLAQVRFSYLGFDGQLRHDGRIVVMNAVAGYVLQIFDTLRSKNFPIAKARLMNDYDGDDEASMADNNTSAFNDRPIAGTSFVSIHAFGLAIDINPIQNPYIKREARVLVISPKAGSKYTDRKNLRPGMAETIVDVFADNGFVVWGGLWRNPIDYQHFQVTPDLASKLARTSPENGKFVFDRYVERYRKCVSALSAGARRQSCIGVVRP
jgi:hypothetical protein